MVEPGVKGHNPSTELLDAIFFPLFMLSGWRRCAIEREEGKTVRSFEISKTQWR